MFREVSERTQCGATEGVFDVSPMGNMFGADSSKKKGFFARLFKL